MAKQANVQHVESVHPGDGVELTGLAGHPKFDKMVEQALTATATESSMSLMQAIRSHKKAAFWSVLLSTTLVMEGYDNLLLANLFAFPQFQKKFGHIQPDGSYVVSAAWRSGLTNGASVGEIIGLQFTGWAQDRFGYRKTIAGALISVTGFVFIVFFAQSLPMLLVGEVFCGISWGFFQTSTTAYASEVCPVALRGYLTTYVNASWVFGQFIASGVLRACLGINSEWGYRIPFGLQWVWPVPLLIAAWCAPESPWWCVRRGQLDEARKNLLRLNQFSDPDVEVEQTIAMMQYTNELEQELSKGTRYRDCFIGVNLRRTEIVCVVWLIQNVCGANMMYYSSNVYVAAGLPTSESFIMTFVQYALGVIGTLVSWVLLSHFGRRSIYLYALCALFACLFVIGCASLAPSQPARDWAIGSMLLLFTFLYDSSVGPVCYSLVSELSSLRLRAKSIVLARNVYNIAGIVDGIFTNYQFTKTAWNWGTKSGFFWAGACALSIIWVFFRLPEPKGRTYAELDILFGNKISARKFKYTHVDIRTKETTSKEEAR